MASINDLSNGGFSLDLQIHENVDSNKIMKYLMKCVYNIIKCINKKSHISINKINIIPHEEIDLLLNDFNKTHVDFSEEKCMHEFFEEQVLINPNKIAIIDGDASITYQDLNNRANHLALILRDKGVKCDCLVGICMNRSIHMIISALAVLKAGGGYVPLDIYSPINRLEYVIKDSSQSTSSWKTSPAFRNGIA
jgi:non-ribosomal peptide synthetase component F